MADHYALTGPNAVHPFAFFQATDPALDPANHVAEGKAWIDTANGNAFKIRNASNAWTTVIAGSSQVVSNFRLVSVLVWQVAELPDPVGELVAFSLVNYV